MGITLVAGTPVSEWHTAPCHCGAVELRLHLPDGIVDPRRCDCSMCRRRGAIAASVAEDGLEIVRGGEHLRRYQFNTHVAEHYFCSVCGIYTHHRRRSNPRHPSTDSPARCSARNAGGHQSVRTGRSAHQ